MYAYAIGRDPGRTNREWLNWVVERFAAHDYRFPDLLQQMGSGKLGMYLATGDNIPIIVGQYKGNYNNIGLAPVPEGGGSLVGGPRPRGDGVLQAYLADPDGNIVELMQSGVDITGEEPEIGVPR